MTTNGRDTTSAGLAGTLITDGLLDTLADLARQATYGPWIWDAPEGDTSRWELRSLGAWQPTVLQGVVDREADRHYLAAVSPDVVLALIAALREARRSTDTTCLTPAAGPGQHPHHHPHPGGRLADVPA